MNKVLLKYRMPHRKPVKDVSDGNTYRHVLHMGRVFCK
jgi:hypothetical protein